MTANPGPGPDASPIRGLGAMEDGRAGGLPTRALLGGPNQDAWRTLLAHTQSLAFEAGELLLRRGAEDRALCLVLEGELEVLVADGMGGQGRRIALIEEGSVFGEQSFLDGEPRSADIRALGKGRLRILSFAAFERLCAADPRLGLALLADLGRVASERLRATTAFVAQVLAEAEGTRADDAAPRPPP